jgi:hypothetical protein
MNNNYKLLNTLIATMLLICSNVNAANYYWVGGSGNWSELANWASTSGGPGNAYSQVPTSADNVFFDANSFTAAGQTVSINQTIVNCFNMDWTGVTNNPTFESATGRTLSIWGSLILVGNMNLTGFNTTTVDGGITFRATSSGHIINMMNKTVACRINFDGNAGAWNLAGGITTTNDIFLLAGSVTTNNHPITCRLFNSSNSNVRGLSLGSSVVTCTYSLFFWDVTNSTNFTFDAGTSHIIGSGSQAGFGTSFRGGGRTYYNLSFTGTLTTALGGTLEGNNFFNDVVFLSAGNITGNNTINNLTFSPGNTYTLTSARTQIIQGLLNASGTCVAPVIITSTLTTQSTISKASGIVSLQYVQLSKINAIGGATFEANNSIDLGNNTGWSFGATTPVTLYWIGDTGNWDDGNKWSLSSGGTPYGCIPTANDNVIFDDNSFSINSQVVTINLTNANCNNMTWVNISNNPSFINPNTLNIYGSLTLHPSMSTNFTNTSVNSGLNFLSTTIGQTINMAGNNLACRITFNGIGGSWLLQNGISTTNDIFLENGSVTTNNHPLTCRLFNSSNSNVRGLSLGSSVVTCNYALFFWDVTNSTNFTFDAGTSHIIGSGSQSGFGTSFRGGGRTYCNLSFTGTLTTALGGTLEGNNTFNDVVFLSRGNITGNNTFNNLTFSPGNTYTLTSARTQIINGSLNASGTCLAPVTITTSLTAQSTISKASGTISLQFVQMSNINATGGAAFQASNSTDLGNNTGWDFGVSASITLYWIGNGGNWDDGNKWSLSSGGAPYGCIPTAIDNVIFDANSFSINSQVVTINLTNANCNNMSWVNISNNPTFTNPNTLNIYGTLALHPSMSTNFTNTSVNTGLNFLSTNSGQTINMAGNNLACRITFNGIGGSWQLLNSISTTNDIFLENGTVTTNNHALTCRLFNSSNSNVRALYLGSSVVTCTYVLFFWDVTNSTNFTFDAGTSHIIGSGSQSGFGSSFRGGGKTYYNLSFTGNIAGALGGTIAGNNTFNNVSFIANGAVTGNNTFNDLTFSPSYTYTFTSGTNQIFNGELNFSGTGSFPVRIQSSNAGNVYTFTKANGVVCLDFIRISDNTATGGASWNAGANSEDLGGNTGWNFGSTVLSITPSEATICAGSSVSLEVNGGGNYTWSPSTGLSTTSGSTVIASPDVTTTYTVSSDVGGLCSGSQTVTVNVSGEAGSVLIMQDPENVTSLCSGEITLFIDGAGLNDILWSTGATNTNTIIINQAGSYSLTAIDNFGCSVTSNVVNIDAGETPEVDIVATQNFLCPGETIQLTTQTNFSSYEWSTGANSQTISVTETGSYSVTVTDINGCVGTSEAFIIELGDIPIAGFDYEQSQNLEYTILFTNTSTFGNTYLWNSGNGNSSTQENPSFTYPFDGTYTVTLIVSNGCGSDTMSILVNVDKLSVNDVSVNGLVFVFPNPFNNQIHINIDQSIVLKDLNINVFNTLGQKVYNNMHQQNNHSFIIEFDNIPDGIYTVLLCNDGKCTNKKLIKN